MKFQKTLMLLFVLICCLTGCGKDKMTVTADLDKNNGTVENETIIKSEQDKEVLMEEAAPEYDRSIPVSFVDYDALMAQMGDRERDAFREYLPVLTGEERFIVTYAEWKDNERGEFTLYEWFDTIFPVKECDLSFSHAACLDLDNDGTLEVIIPFWSYWDEYLVLHKEGELFYGISIGSRGFACLQQNGYFITSGGAPCTHVERLAFCDGTFVVTEHAHACEYSEPAYEIEGQAADKASWDAWYQENFNKEVIWYEAQPNLSLTAEAEETLRKNGLEIPKDCYIRRVTVIPSEEFYIERVWVDYLVQPENAYKHCEDYYFFYDKEMGDFLNCLHEKVSDYEPYEACNFFAHMEDVNFDGREDLVIHNGYTRTETAYRAWLQTEDGFFVYCPEFLEKMGDYELDFEQQAVIGQWYDRGYDGCRGDIIGWYHFEENEYKLFYKEYSQTHNLTPDKEYYRITLGVSYDEGAAAAAYIYQYPRHYIYPESWDEEEAVYAVIKPEDGSDSLFVTFYADKSYTEELYTLRLRMTNPEFMLEKITFGDYNQDGYLDMKLPCSPIESAGRTYTVLLQNPDTGRFE